MTTRGTATGGARERRQNRRLRTVAEHGIKGVRIRPGLAATIVDVSAGGALLETAHRLMPGRTVEVHMDVQTRHARVRGRVVRCAVALVNATGVGYRGAIAFEHRLSWLPEDGYAVPTTESRAVRSERADITRVGP